MISSAEDVRRLLGRVLEMSTADEVDAAYYESSESNLRFANNAPTTNGIARDAALHVSCVYGKRVGRASTSQTDNDSLRRVVEHAERIARLSPESPEYMPRLGEQQYSSPSAWDEQTASLPSEQRTQIASDAIDGARAQGLVAAGYLDDGWALNSFANSAGGFGYFPQTFCGYSLTARTEQGNGSGWAAAASHRASSVNGRAVTDRAIAKALLSRDPVELEARTYPVILEPSAMGDLIGLYYFSLDRRSADEGRSFFSSATNGTKIGEKLFGSDVTIYSDPNDQLAPSAPWSDDGQPVGRTDWVTNGVQRNLVVSRFWAREKSLVPVPFATNIIMNGGTSTLDELVASMDFGLLVTSVWYIRSIDPQTILHTGLTRDGLFLIERGEITRPVVNFRWNESPADAFRAIEAMTPAERVVARQGSIPIVAPAAKIAAFRFSSVSPST